MPDQTSTAPSQGSKVEGPAGDQKPSDDQSSTDPTYVDPYDAWKIPTEEELEVKDMRRQAQLASQPKSLQDDEHTSDTEDDDAAADQPPKEGRTVDDDPGLGIVANGWVPDDGYGLEIHPSDDGK